MLKVERIQSGGEALYLKGYMFYQEELAGWDWCSGPSPSIRVFLGVSSVFSRAFYYSVWPELSVRHRQTTWMLLVWMWQHLPTRDAQLGDFVQVTATCVHAFLQHHGSLVLESTMPRCFYKWTYSLGKYENNIVDVRIACTQLKCRRIDLVLFWPMQVSHFKAFISWQVIFYLF